MFNSTFPAVFDKSRPYGADHVRDIHAVPAYGRDYRSMAAVKAAWAEGKDFFDSYSRRYLSVRDDVRGQVWVRYSRLQKIIRVQ